MGVAAADEHEILGDRNRLLHHFLMPQRRLENETVRTVVRARFVFAGAHGGSRADPLVTVVVGAVNRAKDAGQQHR